MGTFTLNSRDNPAMASAGPIGQWARTQTLTFWLFWDVSLDKLHYFQALQIFSDYQISNCLEVNFTYLSNAGTLLLCISILYRWTMWIHRKIPMASKQLSRYVSICFWGWKLKDCFRQHDLHPPYSRPWPLPSPRYIEVHPGTRKERESERLSVQDLNQGACPQARMLSWTLSFPTWVNPWGEFAD